MVKVIATGISTRPFQYTETPDHTSSRPSDYSLVKEQFFSSQLSSLTCYAAESYGFVVVTFFQCLSAPGRRIIASRPSLSIGCREKFFSRRPTDFSAVSECPLQDVLYRLKPVQNSTKENRRSRRLRLFVECKSNSQSIAFINAAVQAPRQRRSTIW